MSANRKTDKVMNVVGIMSGTSLDGVDFVLTRVNSAGVKYKDMGSVTYPKKLKEKLLSLAEGELGFREGQDVDFELGEFYSKSLKRIKKNKNWKIDLIGLHGQTVFHNAPKSTCQIGEPSFLKEFGVPVVSDFRSKILSAGGQGAPLAPIFHSEILKKEKNWGFLNLGGIANLTVKNSGKSIFASDLGPANVFLDGAARKILNKEFDRNGLMASRGLPDLKFVKSYLQNNDFFKKRTPKSCGREEFSEKELERIFKKLKTLSKEDIFSTLTEISLLPILSFVKQHKISKLVVSGGGVKNKYMMRRLNKDLSGVEVTSSDEMGWPSQSVEGAAFALLAYYKYKGKSADLSYMGVTKKLGALGRID